MTEVLVAVIGGLAVVIAAGIPVMASALRKFQEKNTEEHNATMRVNRENQALLIHVIETQGIHSQTLDDQTKQIAGLDERVIGLDGRVEKVEKKVDPVATHVAFGASKPFGAPDRPKTAVAIIRPS